MKIYGYEITVDNRIVNITQPDPVHDNGGECIQLSIEQLGLFVENLQQLIQDHIDNGDL